MQRLMHTILPSKKNPKNLNFPRKEFNPVTQIYKTQNFTYQKGKELQTLYTHLLKFESNLKTN